MSTDGQRGQDVGQKAPVIWWIPPVFLVAVQEVEEAEGETKVGKRIDDTLKVLVADFVAFPNRQKHGSQKDSET